MEMLVVVAIIAVLIAIGVPILNGVLEKAREATDMANIRNAYATIMVDVIEDESKEHKKTVDLKQTKDDWQTTEAITSLGNIARLEGYPTAKGECQVYWDTETKEAVFKFDGSSLVKWPDDPSDSKNRRNNAIAYAQTIEKMFQDGDLVIGERDNIISTVTDKNGKVHTIVNFNSKHGYSFGAVVSAMEKLGYPKEIIDRVSTGNLGSRIIVVYEDNKLLGYGYDEAVGSANKYRIVNNKGDIIMKQEDDPDRKYDLYNNKLQLIVDSIK